MFQPMPTSRAVIFCEQWLFVMGMTLRQFALPFQAGHMACRRHAKLCCELGKDAL
jgi:hypothetical protein